jgi:hypothetical protein
MRWPLPERKLPQLSVAAGHGLPRGPSQGAGSVLQGGETQQPPAQQAIPRHVLHRHQPRSRPPSGCASLLTPPRAAWWAGPQVLLTRLAFVSYHFQVTPRAPPCLAAPRAHMHTPSAAARVAWNPDRGASLGLGSCAGRAGTGRRALAARGQRAAPCSGSRARPGPFLWRSARQGAPPNKPVSIRKLRPMRRERPTIYSCCCGGAPCTLSFSGSSAPPPAFGATVWT